MNRNLTATLLAAAILLAPGLAGAAGLAAAEGSAAAGASAWAVNWAASQSPPMDIKTVRLIVNLEVPFPARSALSVAPGDQWFRMRPAFPLSGHRPAAAFPGVRS